MTRTVSATREEQNSNNSGKSRELRPASDLSQPPCHPGNAGTDGTGAAERLLHGPARYWPGAGYGRCSLRSFAVDRLGPD
eukprot:230172-Hanusia_phi.AAC.1